MLLSLLVPLAALLQGPYACAPAQGLPSPKSVWFEAEFFRHVLHWAPGPDQKARTSYQVEVQRYGLNHWEPVPSCNRTLELSCDVTMNTLDLYRTYGYWAKVRAVAGDQCSNWTITNTRFTLDEVTLTIGSLNLEVDDGSIVGTIQPPRPRVAPSGDTYESIFPNYRQYEIAVRKVPGFSTYISLKVNEESFRLSMTGEVGEFCVTVKPSISSRLNQGRQSPEKCVVLVQQYFTATTITIFFVIVLLLGGVPAVCLGLQQYVRRRGKWPTVLDFEKPTPLGLVSQLPYPDPIQPLDEEAFLPASPELWDSELYSSTDSGFSSVRPSLQTQESPTPEAPQALGTPGKRPSLEEHPSDSSTDSGICLQESSLCRGAEAPWEPRQENGHQGQDDSGVGLTHRSEQQPAHDQGGSASDHVAPPGPDVPGEEDPADMAFQGYLKQTRATEEKATKADCLEEETCSPDGLDPKFQMCLEAEVDWTPPLLAKGYLKQGVPGRSLVPTGASAEQWSRPQEEWSLLALSNCGALGASDWSVAPDLAPLECVAVHGGLLGSLDPGLVSLPFISSLHVDE